MQIVIQPDGAARAIYSEEIDLRSLGPPGSYGQATSSQTPKAAGLQTWGPWMVPFWGRWARDGAIPGPARKSVQPILAGRVGVLR